jgi:hypothetical protein
MLVCGWVNSPFLERLVAAKASGEGKGAHHCSPAIPPAGEQRS